MAGKTVNEALDLQSGFTRASFDSVVAQGAKLTEMTLKTANESLAPLQDQVKQAFSAAFSTPLPDHLSLRLKARPIIRPGLFAFARSNPVWHPSG